MKHVLSFLGVCVALVLPSSAQTGFNVPKIDDVARIKEHRGGADGALVPGEEDMKKIIIQWDAIPGALEYEVCHNCLPADPEGELEPGDLYNVPTTQTRSGRPMFVKYDSPLGFNTFHVRASLRKGKWGAWSEPRNFDVKEPGNAQHEEL